MAVQAFSAPDCADFARATELFPAVGGVPAASDQLVLQVNAPASRVRVQLLRADTPVTEAILCVPLEGARIGFTKRMPPAANGRTQRGLPLDAHRNDPDRGGAEPDLRDRAERDGVR